MVVNFRVYGISQSAYKLALTLMLIRKKKVFKKNKGKLKGV
jgi:hypothetical protein